MIGQTFTRWTVLSIADGRPVKMLCRCICGKEKLIRRDHLLSGGSKSCGCLHSERSRERALAGVITKNFDGHSKLPEYSIWCGIKSRCLNPNSLYYKYYGGRGISICEEWLDFKIFLKDMGSRPTPKHTIDRIDNNKNYSPDNCRWASRMEQMNNRNCNVHIFYMGEQLTIAEWSRKLGIPDSTIWNRISLGWPIDKVLSTERHYNLDGLKLGGPARRNRSK